MFDEEIIVKGCREGRRTAQKQLYERYVSTMLAICLRYSKSRDEAEDLLQEGFLKIFQNINTYRKKGSLEGWIKRIMINHALNQYKKNRKIPFAEDVETINESEILSVHDETEHIEPVPPETLLVMIQSLPEGYRMVFNLYVFEGYSHKEIAEAMNFSENTSKTQLMKARRHLQNKISDYTNKKETAETAYVNER
jgi:RNA polymerase sigma factor (sigma-70 family)